jgi:hypothetical protein
MSSKIKISWDEYALIAVLNDSSTAIEILGSLPLEGIANRWGEEIYFSIPVSIQEASDARQDMAVGELGYWPSGSAFCIFFGPTPVSTDLSPRAYSNVNPFGLIEGEVSTLREVQGGEIIRIEKYEG